MRLYTGKGDDGSTGLLFGGRVAKDSPVVEAAGALDEAQAFLGLARAEVIRGDEVDQLLVKLERDLWILMAELATDPANRHKLVAGKSLVTQEMVDAVGALTDDLTTRFNMPSEFVVPGQNRASALLDVARAVVRRAERRALPVAPSGSHAVPYLNRLSSLLWAMARWQEDEPLATREA